MDYNYLPSYSANPFLSSDIIYEYLNDTGILQYICYHITSDSKYPFVQIMLVKTPFCNNIIKEEFVLPSIIFKKETKNYKEIILSDIKNALTKIGCKTNFLEIDAFKGIVMDDDNNCYGLVELNNVDIRYLELKRTSLTWFALPTEIVNIQSICNIPISEKVIDLFTYKKPELSVLHKLETSDYFICPDVVYMCNDYKNAELQLIFGPSKDFIISETTNSYFNDMNDKSYYSFFISFGQAIKENIQKYLDKDDKIGITRFAIFVENKADNFVSDSDCVIVVPKLYVRQFEVFTPLSIHPFNKETVKERYMIL